MKKYQLLFMKNLLHIKIEIQFITETVRLNLKKFHGAYYSWNNNQISFFLRCILFLGMNRITSWNF